MNSERAVELYNELCREIIGGNDNPIDKLTSFGTFMIGAGANSWAFAAIYFNDKAAEQKKENRKIANVLRDWADAIENVVDYREGKGVS